MTGDLKQETTASDADGAEGALAGLDAALISLRRLWAAPSRLNDPTLGEVEMSTIWIVDALDRFPEHREAGVADLAAALDVAHSTASRLVDRAERCGAVARHPGGTDSRRTAVALTASGRDLAAVARAARVGYLARVTAGWDPEQRTALAELLIRFAESVQTTPPHQPHRSMKGSTR